MLRQLLVFAAGCLVTEVAAGQTFDAAAAFGAREDVSHVSLSPDGALLAMIRARPGGGDTVEIVSTAGGEPKTVLRGNRDQPLTDCSWTASTRLVCRVYGIGTDGMNQLSFTRMFAVDANGANLLQLALPENGRTLGYVMNGGRIADLLPDEDGGEVLMTRYVIPERSTGTRLAEQRQGLALERVDTRTSQRKLVESPKIDAVTYLTDGHGLVRIVGERLTRGTGYSADQIHYCYRPVGSRDCRTLSSVDSNNNGFRPVAVDRDLNAAYGFEKQDGRLALFRVSLDGSLKRELVLANPRVDVDGLVRIGRQRRVIGASFATDRRETIMFDPEYRKLTNALGRALGGNVSLSIIDASTDEAKLLLVAGGDTNPGRYYLYDKKTRELNELVAARPALDGAKLATVKPVSYPAADGTVVPGYLTLPPGSAGKGLPAIVMPHGGPGSRDEWGFDWWAQYFANRGFAVLQPNFRGSSGYGDAWFKDNGFKSWRLAVGDVNDGGKWLVSQGIAVPDKLAIVGWSYGGYAALQSPVLDPTLFKAIVAVAPVTDLEMLREESRNYTNFNIVSAFIGAGPHVREGSPAQNVDKIKAPVLMFHGDKDLNVGIGESRAMDARLKSAGKPTELVVYPGLDHQLDDSPARTDMLRKSDAFLRKHLGM